MGISRSFVWTPRPGDDLFAIPLPFDPGPVFGRRNAPVVVDIGGHSYRSTVTNMGGSPWVPFRRSNRAASGIEDGTPGIEVTLTLDVAERTVAVPDDLAAELAAIPGARDIWDKLSVTRRREHVEGIESAKRAETRQSRIVRAVDAVKQKLDKET